MMKGGGVLQISVERVYKLWSLKMENGSQDQKKSKNYFKHKFEIIEACTPYFLDTHLDPVAYVFL